MPASGGALLASEVLTTVQHSGQFSFQLKRNRNVSVRLLHCPSIET